MEGKKDGERNISRAGRLIRTSGKLLGIFVFLAAYMMMCWYLFAVCDLAHINF